MFSLSKSLEDMKRNALASVFLRILKYCDGILILTSNRVGTFDEAFKSRIQLALHYPVLEAAQRHKIWIILISRLENLKEGIDFQNLGEYLPELSAHKMNGRQILNTITTARQCAQWKAQKQFWGGRYFKLNFGHLEDLIEVSGRFDIYIDKLNDNCTQDQLVIQRRRDKMTGIIKQ